MSTPFSPRSVALPKRGVRREIFWLLVFVLAVLVPLVLIVRWREKAPVQRAQINPESPWLLEYKRQGRGFSFNGIPARIALSPTGDFLAAICPTKPTAANPNASGERLDLVVWRVRDRKEIARSNLSMEGGGDVKWTASGNYIAVVGRFSHVFHWKTGTLMTTPVNPALTMSNSTPTDLDIMSTQLDLAGDVKIQSTTSSDLQAFRISSGAPLPVRWKFSRNDSASRNIYQTILQPNPANAAAKNPKLFAAILQEEETPRPVATPTPVPTPTPALTSQQKAFIEKELRWGEEVSLLMEKIQSDDPPPAEEVARMETRIVNGNAKFKAERRLLFPIPTPTPSPRYLRELRTVRFSLWNLSNNTKVWERIFKVDSVSNLEMKWSPDGRVLALLGRELAAETTLSNQFRREGVEFYEAATGRHLATAQPREGEFLRKENSFWISDETFMLWDRDANHQPVLNFIDSQTGKSIERLKLPWHLAQADSISTDATNSLWAFASAQHGWEVLTRGQIVEAANGSQPNIH